MDNWKVNVKEEDIDVKEEIMDMKDVDLEVKEDIKVEEEVEDDVQDFEEIEMKEEDIKVEEEVISDSETGLSLESDAWSIVQNDRLDVDYQVEGDSVCSNSCVEHVDVQTSHLEKVEKTLLNWIQQMQLFKTPLSFNCIKKKALEFHECEKQKEPVDCPEFNASFAWFRNFCHRCRICLEFLVKEEVSNDEPPPLVSEDVDEVAASDFVRKMKSTFDCYSPCALFNAIKTDVFWKMPLFPLQTNVGEKLALILCANASGDFRLRPAFFVSEEHNTLSPEDLESLPVYFVATQSGEIDDSEFMRWYSKEFIPKVSEYLRQKSLPLKALLLLDDTYSHLSNSFQLHDSNFKVVFFPPRTAALIQPLTQPNIFAEFMKAVTSYSDLPETAHASANQTPDPSCVDSEKSSSFATLLSPFSAKTTSKAEPLAGKIVPYRTYGMGVKNTEKSPENCTTSENLKCKDNQRKITSYFKRS